MNRRATAECMQEADHREQRDADLGELEPLRHPGLVEAVGDLAAERRQEEERRDEDRAASVISVSRCGPPSLNRIRKTSAFFRKLSLNAEKNWHQNRGAKRRVSSRESIVSALSSAQASHNSHLRVRRH